MDLDSWMQVDYIITRKRKRIKNGTFPSVFTTITPEVSCYRASWLDPTAAAAAHLKLPCFKLLNSLSMLTCILGRGSRSYAPGAPGVYWYGFVPCWVIHKKCESRVEMNYI